MTCSVPFLPKPFWQVLLSDIDEHEIPKNMALQTRNLTVFNKRFELTSYVSSAESLRLVGEEVGEQSSGLFQIEQ